MVRAASSDGWHAIAQSVRLRVVAVLIAKHATIFTFAFLPPALVAAVEGELVFAATLLGAAGASFLVATMTPRTSLPSDLRMAEAMAGLALVFVLAALLSVPAFVSVGMTPPGALFEAMSGITTTGLSVAAAPDDWAFSVHFFRSWLQWVGGLVMATAVLALILPAGLPSLKLGRVGIDQGDRISSTRAQARQLLVAYGGLTLVMGLALVALMDAPGEAVLLTLSAVSTGGFAPRSDSLASYDLGIQALVMLGCVLGAVSLLTFVLIAQGKLHDALKLGSLRRICLAILITSILYVCLAMPQTRDPVDLAEGVLNLVSAMTTAGYSTSAMPGAGALLLLLIAVMAVGADNGSTGGGLKLSRIIFAVAALRQALRAPFVPERAVFPMKSNGKSVAEPVFVGVLALATAYGATALFVWAHFLIHGYAFDGALFETISALSTVGLSVGIVGPDLPTDLKLSLTLAMWLGRLEFLAVILLFLPKTWQQRS